jgi:hypothetical protein
MCAVVFSYYDGDSTGCVHTVMSGRKRLTAPDGVADAACP